MGPWFARSGMRNDEDRIIAGEHTLEIRSKRLKPKRYLVGRQGCRSSAGRQARGRGGKARGSGRPQLQEKTDVASSGYEIVQRRQAGAAP